MGSLPGSAARRPRSRGVPPDARAVTSHDVARLAGVSQPTVSRALRGDERVAAGTRERILDAARKLDYQPHHAGRVLSTRATQQIAMIADLRNPLYPRLVGPIHDTLLERGYRMVLFAERDDEGAAYERLLDRSVDGVILTTTLLHSALPAQLTARGLPSVQLTRVSDRVAVDTVTAANADGAAAAARLLLAGGHRDVGALFGPEDTSTSRDRERGLRDALGEAGVALPARWTKRGGFDHGSGHDGLLDLMSGARRPTAVFCVNDVVAVGALNAALALGLRVPGDLSVVGFDDLDLASWPSFRLTTVRVDLAGMAERAAELLVERLEQPQTAPRHEVFPAELVARATHAAAPR